MQTRSGVGPRGSSGSCCFSTAFVQRHSWIQHERRAGSGAFVPRALRSEGTSGENSNRFAVFALLTLLQLHEEVGGPA